jgi:anthranilate synthase
MTMVSIPGSVNTHAFAELLTATPVEEFLTYGNGRGRIRRLTLPLDYAQASLAPLPLFQRLNTGKPGVLFESVDISRVYGRYSLAVIDPPVLVEGKEDAFSIRALNERGHDILGRLTPADFPCSTDLRKTAQAFEGTVPCERRPVAEDERLRLNNISQIIRHLLQTFRCHDRFLGLYGAFAYDFVRLFEPLPERLPPIPTQDFRLFLPDTLLFYDHLRERAFVHMYDFSGHVRPAADMVHVRLEPLCAAAPVQTTAGQRPPCPISSSRTWDVRLIWQP